MKLKAIFFCFTVLTLLTAATGLYFYYNAQKAAAYNEDRLVSIAHADSIEHSVSQLISRYHRITLSLSRYPELTPPLDRPSAENLNSANRILDIYNVSMQTSVCYLMNTDGITIASSNRDDGDSFVGKDYSFRPYFRNAIQGKPAVYLAQGVTSGKRGIYFSNPVYGDAGTVVGVVVIKEEVEEIEEEIIGIHAPTHVQHEDFVFIVDENGLIFISDHPGMILHTLWKTDRISIDRIKSSQQFGKGPWPWVGFEKLSQETVTDQSGKNYNLIVNELKTPYGWKIVHLTDADAISERVFSSLFEAAGYVLLFNTIVMVSVLIILNFLAANAEKSIRDSEERYRTVAETVDEGIVLQAASGEILTWNRGAQKIFGIPAEVAVGATSEGNDWPTIHRDGSKYEGKDHPSMKTLRTGKPYKNEIMGVNRPSGELRWISINTNPMFKENDDRPYAVAISFSDVTEIEQNRRDLQESQAMLKAAMDFSQAGIAIAKAPDGELLYVNDSALDIRGEAKEKVVEGIGIDQYVSSWQILHFDGTPYEPEEVPLARAILFGETCTKEFIVRRPDREERIVWANAAPIRNEKGEITYGIVVFLDITDRKKAEHENDVNRIRLEIGHKIATMPKMSETKMWDYVLERMLELSDSRIGFLGILTPDEQEMQIHNWSKKVMTECAVHDQPIHFPIAQAGIWGEPVRTRKPIILNDYDEFHPAKKGYPEGHVRVSRFMAVPVVDGDKMVAIAAVGNGQRPYGTFDCQQLRLLMESVWAQIQRFSLQQERENLKSQIRNSQRIEAIGNLAGGIAHDFNNILFPIVGISEMLLEDLPPGGVEWENAKEILQAGKRGSALVKQILAFSRQSEQKKIPTRAQTVLKEVITLSRSTIPSYIEINQHIQPDCGMIMADPTQIHQIAMNIITNAYHSIEPNGGSISVRLAEKRLEKSHLPDPNLEPGNYVVLSIADTGQGIPQENIDKIFDPYFTTKEQGKGTGLGLAVVHGIVKEHGGAIKVTSEIGKGSTFQVYLPLMKQADTAERLDLTEELPLGKERILLVDDEESIVRLEKQMLERLGYRVTVRNSSTDALKAFKSRPGAYDLVITDMSMPNMTGDRLTIELKLIQPDIPVIICTGFSERINKEKAKEAGIGGFLMKPVVKSDLAQKVRKVLDEAKGSEK